MLVWSCRKPNGANWDIDVILPVVNSSLNITNFAGDSLFETDNTGLLHFHLNRQVASLLLDSLLNIPDTALPPQSFTLGIDWPLKAGLTLPLPQPDDIEFDISNGVQLIRADIRKGTLHVKFSNSAPEPIDLVYILPGTRKDGVPLKIVETLAGNEATLEKSYDLAGYQLNLRGANGKQVNTLSQQYSVTVNSSASDFTLQAGKGARLEIDFSDLVPQYVLGYFGQEQVDLPVDTARFSLINNLRATNFMLAEATMDFSIVNEFGADFRANLEKIKSINTIDNKIVALQTNQLANINIDRAHDYGGAVQSSTRSILFTSSNSNITSFISNLPDKLSYNGTVTVNPPPLENAGFGDFAYYNTGLRIFADINIPLRFNAEKFTLQTSANVNFSNVEQLDRVNSGSFNVTASNSFPFEARLQAYLLDVDKKVIDSLFVPGFNTIAGGQVDAQNLVTAPAKSKLLLPVDDAKIANLKLCKSIMVVSSFILPPNPPAIDILESYRMDVNIIAEMNYNVGIRR
jgi:hypothetical protein